MGQGRAQGPWGEGSFLQGECKPLLCPGESQGTVFLTRNTTRVILDLEGTPEDK